MTFRVVGKTFGYAIVFKNFTRVKQRLFYAYKNFTVPSDQSPSKAYDQAGDNSSFSFEFGCRGDPKQELKPTVFTFITITGGDERFDEAAPVTSCGTRIEAAFSPF